mgnify:CR=1 FL=1
MNTLTELIKKEFKKCSVCNELFNKKGIGAHQKSHEFVLPKRTQERHVSKKKRLKLNTSELLMNILKK